MTKSYDLQAMCFELCEQVVDVLDADGAGVTVADNSDRLRYVTATSDEATKLELTQEHTQTGPCRTAYDDGRTVVVDDVKLHSLWPQYLEVAETVGVGAVLGVPLRTDGERLGAIDVYSYGQRAWSEEEVTAAGVFADMATAYFLRTSELEEASRLGDQLQHALDSRVIIEQAKGMLASRYKVGIDEAFESLRTHARSSQQKLTEVARAVVEDGYQLPSDEF